MFDWKTILSLIGIALAIIGYASYYRQLFKRQVKPHAFSWFVWALLTGIGFAAQVSAHGGAGAWVTGFSALLTFSIFIIALFWGVKKFVLFDWLSLAGALIAMIIWGLTKDPVGAVIMVTIVDTLGFFPTLRKGYLNPFEEGATVFALSSIKFIFGIAALDVFNLTTVLYPASLIVANGGFTIMLLVRRKQLGSVTMKTT